MLSDSLTIFMITQGIFVCLQLLFRAAERDKPVLYDGISEAVPNIETVVLCMMAFQAVHSAAGCDCVQGEEAAEEEQKLKRK